MLTSSYCVQVDIDAGRFPIGSLCSEDYREIFNALSSARSLYPCFEKWFYEKVLVGLDSDERKILTEYSADGRLAGIAILKVTSKESKLCNLTILPEFQKRGFGIRLFNRVFEELGTQKPFLTVSEEKYPEFKRLFDYFGFEVTSVKDGLYRSDRVEYFLNEPVSSLI